MTIKVTNVDEAPDIDGDNVTKDYPENGKAQVARFTAKDPEKRMVYWSLADAAVVDAAEVTSDDVADQEHFTIKC